MSQAIAHQSLEPQSLARVRSGLKSELWRLGQRGQDRGGSEPTVLGGQNLPVSGLATPGQRVSQMKRQLATVSSASGSRWERCKLPRGIAGRVALSRLPDASRPRWLGQTACIADHNVYSGCPCGHQCFYSKIETFVFF